MLFVQIPADWIHLSDCPQYQNNDLYVGNSKTSIGVQGKKGLFTAKNVKAGRTLCIKTGIILQPKFLDYSDYDTTNIRIVYFKNGNSFLVDRDDRPNYADYAIDPLDPSKVNVQLEVIFTNGLIVLKCIKDSIAGDELLISFGMV